ncbi:hypothetical protein CR513_10682, partial [Mucuna pruriens]
MHNNKPILRLSEPDEILTTLEEEPQSMLPHIDTILKWFMKLSQWMWLHQAHDTTICFPFYLKLWFVTGMHLEPLDGTWVLWTLRRFFGRYLGSLDGTWVLWTNLMDVVSISVFKALPLDRACSKAQGLFCLDDGAFEDSTLDNGALEDNTLDASVVLNTKDEMKRDSSDEMESYPPKTRKVMRHMKRLKEKLENLGGRLESMRIDTQSVSVKVEALTRSKGKSNGKIWMISAHRESWPSSQLYGPAANSMVQQPNRTSQLRHPRRQPSLVPLQRQASSVRSLLAYVFRSPAHKELGAFNVVECRLISIYITLHNLSHILHLHGGAQCLSWCFSQSRKHKSRTERPKVIRGDLLACYHTLVDLILSALANRGEPSSSSMAIVVEDGSTKFTPYIITVSVESWSLSSDSSLVTDTSDSVEYSSTNNSAKQMKNNNKRTLKELATPDIVRRSLQALQGCPCGLLHNETIGDTGTLHQDKGVPILLGWSSKRLVVSIVSSI